MKRMAWLTEAVLLTILSLPIALLPHRIALRAGELLGLFTFFVWTSRRKIAVENIRKSIESGGLASVGPPERIARKNFLNLGRSAAEVIKIYYGLGTTIIERVEIRGLEHYQKALLQGKGILFITGHCGNWELMAISFGVQFPTLAVVARKQNNPYINSMIEKIRARYGNRVIYKSGALKAILSELKQNGKIGILMDQAVVEDEGYLIDFLGRKAWTMKIPALLARRTEAAVLPAFIHREGDRQVIEIFPHVEMVQNDEGEDLLIQDTKQFTGHIENYIMKHPDEWLWIHRRWKRTGAHHAA